MLMEIASKIGKLVVLDDIMTLYQKMGFAKLRVELDLSKFLDRGFPSMAKMGFFNNLLCIKMCHLFATSTAS